MLLNSLPWLNHLELEALPLSVGTARQVAADVLHGWHLDHLADTAALLVSELVTNAIKTAAIAGTAYDGTAQADTGGRTSAAERVTVDLCYDGNVLSIEVWDPLREGTPVLREASWDDESGRGILLVASLSRQWGCYAPRSGGKVVWCELAAASPRSVPSQATRPSSAQSAAVREQAAVQDLSFAREKRAERAEATAEQRLACDDTARNRVGHAARVRRISR